jgi:hypothetical protein
MRAGSLPRFQPGQAIVSRPALWYAALFVAVLLVCAALVVASIPEGRPPDGELLGPFRWLATQAVA